jgi:hypothetical protein
MELTMKPNLFPVRLAAFLGGLLLSTMTCAAPLLSIDRIGAASISPGGLATYQLRLNSPTEVIAAFSVDIDFNAAVLEFTAANFSAARFGTMLGDPLTEGMSLMSVFNPGVLHIDQTSFLSNVALASLQQDAFGQLLTGYVLAEFSLTGIGAGTSALEFVAGSVQFSDANGASLPAPALQGSAAINVVPEPASSGLVMLALGALLAAGRRRTCAADE